MKFLVIGCYGLADGYKAMTNGLRYIGHDISFYPLFEGRDYYNQNEYNYKDDIIRAINGEKLGRKYINYINMDNDKIDYIIWWHNIDNNIIYYDLLDNIKKSGVKLIQINWDATINYKKYEKKYFVLFDYIFTVNPVLLNYIKNKYNLNNIYHFNQSFDTDYSYYLEDNKYKCDISILCTNLYTHSMWTDKKICRKKLLDIIYENEDINLHIYGPKFLEELYPRAYKGYISYNKSHLVFSNSLINLNISPVGDSLTDIIDEEECYYFSERMPQILACKGLMVSDQDYGKLLDKKEDYIILEKEEDIIKILEDIKDSNINIEKIKENGYKKVCEKLDCIKFGQNIIKCLNC